MKTILTTWLVSLVFLAYPAIATAEVRVVASLPDLAAIVAEVGGERVDVESLAPATADPHYIDPRPSFVLALNKADLLVRNGLDLESGWLDPLVREARNPKLRGGNGVFEASRHANLIGTDRRVDRSEGDVHPGGNPHFYRDPASAITIANALRDRLTAIDPEGKAVYAANAKKFTAELWDFVRMEAVRFAKLPAAKKRVIAYHESLGYTFRWLGLEQVTTVEPKPGIPPNPKHVAGVLKLMRTSGADVIVQEEYYPRETSNSLAKLAKGEVVVLPGATKFDAGQRYIEMVRESSRRLYDALSK